MSRGSTSSGPTDPAPVVPPGLAVQHFEKGSAAGQLLSQNALERLCGTDVPNQARRAQLDLSHVIVAAYHDEPMGFAAYKPGAAGVRVAHEFWVDAKPPCGLAALTDLLLGHLEQAAHTSACSKLFIVVPHTTPLRQILQSYGYVITFEGADLLCFEKAFHSEPHRAG